MKKIVIVGTSSSGKTTLAIKLSKKFKANCCDQDELFWLPGWKRRPIEEFRALVVQAVMRDSWIVSGNYSVVRDIVWEDADTIIWLDYSLFRCLYQGVKRALQNIFMKKVFCNGNRESFSQLFCSRYSIIWWITKSHFIKRRRYKKLICDSKYSHIKFLRFESPGDTKAWLESI